MLYGLLSKLNPSTVVELNRAVATAMGPEYGLEIIDPTVPALSSVKSFIIPGLAGVSKMLFTIQEIRGSIGPRPASV